MEENEKFARDPIEVDQQLNNPNNQSTSRSLDPAEIYPDPKQKQETQPTKSLSYSKTKKRGISWWYFPGIFFLTLGILSLIYFINQPYESASGGGWAAFALMAWGFFWLVPVFTIRLAYKLYKKYKN